MERKNKKIITMPIIFSVILVVLVFVSFSLFREIMRNRAIDKEIEKIENEAERLEAKNLEILELVKKLENTEFLEKEARLKMGLQKPGERAVVINRIGSDIQLPASAEKIEEMKNPIKWWYYFFKDIE